MFTEIDGGQHADNERYDLQRTKYLQKKGYHVIRFWNNEVLRNSTAVLEKILPPPNLPLKKKGEEYAKQIP